MKINRLIKSLFITILIVQFLGCSSDKGSDVLQPDDNINRRYLSVRHLEFSSSKVEFNEQSKGSKTVKSFSVSNHEKNYPIKFSIDNIPNNITFLDTSTCQVDNATVYPGEDCVYSILLSNNEEGNHLDNITFYDNYSEVYLGVSSNVTARGVEPAKILRDDVGTINSAQNIELATSKSVQVFDSNIDDVGTTNSAQNIELTTSKSVESVQVFDSNIDDVASANFPLVVNKEYHSYGIVDMASKEVSTDFVITNRSSSQVDFDISSLTSNGYIVHPVSTCKVGANKLPAGKSCFVYMVFSPRSSTIYNDSFQVSYGSEKISISLTGVGAKRYTDINSLKLSEEFIEYGTVANGEFRVHRVTVQNRSNDSFMKFSLADISDGFSYLPSSTCGIYFTTLPPSQSCELAIKYLSPSNGGSVNLWINNLFKEIKFLSNSSDENIMSIDQSVVDFDNILVNSISSNIFTLNNNSNIDQSVSITSSDDIKIVNAETTIEAGSSKNISLSLQPKNIDRDYKSNIKVKTSDGLDYILPVKAEVVEFSNIDATQFLSSASIGESVYIYDDNMLMYNPLIDNISNQLSIYNISSLTWSKVESVGVAPKHGIGADLLFFGDALYLFGGEDKDGALSNNLSYFDTINKKWNNIFIDDKYIKPTARKGYKGVVAKDKLFIMGGVDGGGNQLGDIWVYDLNRGSNGWTQLDIDPLFSTTEMSDASTILLSDNESLYILVANKVYSYRIDGDLKWKEEYSIVGIDALNNIDASIRNNVLYITGNKIGNDKLFLNKLDLITGKTVEIETNVTINSNFKSIINSSNDGFIYLFLMFDDKVSNKFYYFNDISSTFVEIDMQIYPYIEKIDASVLYNEYVYTLGSDNKLYNYNLNTKRFEYKNTVDCANISAIVAPHLISDSNRNKLYVIDGSNNMCEYDIALDRWMESSIGSVTGVQDNFSVAIHDNHLWLYGGIKSDNTVSDDLWKYKINGSSGWVKVTKASSPATLSYGVYDHKMVVYGDVLYIVGGYLDISRSKNNSILRIDLSEELVSLEVVSTLDTEQQLSDNFGIALYKSGFVLLGLNDIKSNILYYNVVDSEFTVYRSISGDYFDKEYVSNVISFGSALYIQNNLYQRVSKIVLQ